MTFSKWFMGLAATSALAVGCGDAGTDKDEAPFTSDQATLLTFEFDAELVTDNPWSASQIINDQLLYTIGHLNGSNGVGRLDRLVLSSIKKTPDASGMTKITYHAVLPVGWGSKTNLPTSYEFTLPKRIDGTGLAAFTQKYEHSCVDFGAHDVDSGSMWYYFRPHRSGCSLAQEDVVKTTAAVTVSAENTKGKYPEYHKVWEDGALTVVAIFGKYEDGATTSADAGVAGYNRFTQEIRSVLGSTTTTTPASLPSDPGVAFPDVTFDAKLADGRKVQVVALLVDNVRTAGPAFDQRYESLSGNADLIFYNGHAGLGQNVRALANKGEFLPGKYQIFFMNGCDTFAYVDGSLAQTRAQLNPDDPTGTKYMEIVTNLMPSFFSSMPYASMALINGLLGYDAPQTYEQIFQDIDKSEVVVVTGEEDNVFQPGMQPPPDGGGWEGMKESGSVGKDEQVFFETPELPAGSYEIAISEDPSQPGGDADLYVGLGKVPTKTSYDYRPYKNGSNEKVTFELTKPTQVEIMVHGYEKMSAPKAAFLVTGRAL